MKIRLIVVTNGQDKVGGNVEGQNVSSFNLVRYT